jgi:N-acetylglucosamine-6-phosphate deacetylase
MRTAFLNGPILLETGWREDLALLVEKGRVAALLPEASLPADAVRIDLEGESLVPGLIDVQVNGGGGTLFNDAPTVEGIAAIAAAHRRLGTAGLLPTLISGDLALIDRAMRAVEAAIEQGVPGVLGIHLEGPFLNPLRRGAHAAAALRPISETAIRLLTSLKRGRTLLTLAPEMTDPVSIARLAAAGVVVSAGHTEASLEQTRAALRAGVTGFTHLFNAMAPLASRAPGAVGAALESRTAFVGLIVDGWHVSPATLRLVLRTRPLDRFVLVSDAMPTVGGPCRSFLLDGRRVEAVDGACRDETGALAGSDLNLARAVANAVELLGLSLADAVAMASAAPARFLGLQGQRGRIRPGAVADLLRLGPGAEVRGIYAPDAPLGEGR